MCLLVLAWQTHPRFDLLVAANRDEQHARATAALDYWPEVPGMAAGRDLVAGGSWLAVDRQGRFAGVTNFRGEPSTPGSSRSRGRLVTDFLAGSAPAAQYLEALAAEAGSYPGFNLLLVDGQELWYASNRSERFARRLGPGVHGLSNDLLDVAWPKVERCMGALREHLDAGHGAAEPLFDMLGDRQRAPAPGAPGLPWPATSGPFIAHALYGTRSSTLVTREPGATWVSERRFGPAGDPQGQTQLRLPHRA